MWIVDGDGFTRLARLARHEVMGDAAMIIHKQQQYT
jgi:hypothetical protein